MFLQGLPLAHQIPDLPHQRLMAIDHRLGGVRIVVEAGRGDCRLELLDLRLPVGDAPFQFRDSLVQCIGRTLLPFAVGIELLPLFPGEVRGLCR